MEARTYKIVFLAALTDGKVMTKLGAAQKGPVSACNTAGPKQAAKGAATNES